MKGGRWKNIVDSVLSIRAEQKPNVKWKKQGWGVKELEEFYTNSKNKKVRFGVKFRQRNILRCWLQQTVFAKNF